MRKRSLKRSLRLGLGFVVSGLLGLGPAQAERSWFFAEDDVEWERLIRIQDRVPGFAGLILTSMPG